MFSEGGQFSSMCFLKGEQRLELCEYSRHIRSPLFLFNYVRAKWKQAKLDKEWSVVYTDIPLVYCPLKPKLYL